jgi:hypothetical protein
MRLVSEHELPPDPDLYDLPDDLWRHPGPFTISGVDPETGERFSFEITKEELATAFADRRRAAEDDAA